ncbi:hypothetical protein SAMN02745121_00817 [Nannocystis exedens]|uniref:Uncharacterized protein n=1 Tax=Nannocystis exedens TaxID=54 RepID=A0A1I1TY75_9BACT|nr:hypothetical protein [Nannocystis exedens]PCC71277.1 hypothetical protein NAEX_04351 [Nannocystis exedens]SFD63591.1 hypothetical protein SAMN02745121_00817 [Nannocystis exedens]
MNKQENTQSAETTHSQDSRFEVREGQAEDLQVVEFDSVPLTDINFGF